MSESEIKVCKERISELEKENAYLRAENERLESMVRQLEAKLAEIKKPDEFLLKQRYPFSQSTEPVVLMSGQEGKVQDGRQKEIKS